MEGFCVRWCIKCECEFWWVFRLLDGCAYWVVVGVRRSPPGGTRGGSGVTALILPLFSGRPTYSGGARMGSLPPPGSCGLGGLVGNV